MSIRALRESSGIRDGSSFNCSNVDCSTSVSQAVYNEATRGFHLNSRERVKKAIHFEGPDRVPINHHTLIEAWLKYGDRLKELYARYPADIVSFAFPNEYGERVGEGKRDSWGAVWVRLGDDHKGQVIEHPLAEWESLDTYKFPDPDDTEEYDRVAEMMQSEGKEKYVLADGGTLFQRMFYLRGFENILMDLVQRDERALYLRDRILDHILGRIERWNQIGVDGISIRDDWGAQDRLLISPNLWRELFKPAYKAMCEAIHAGGADAHLHTDGYTIQIIPDLIEVGFDDLNPQLSVMDMVQLAGIVAGRVCIRSDIDRQHLLPRGTPHEVEAHVQKIIELFGRQNGGLIGDGEIASDVPLENAEAMLRAFYEKG